MSTKLFQKEMLLEIVLKVVLLSFLKHANVLITHFHSAQLFYCMTAQFKV
jgi:hypothetical protein